MIESENTASRLVSSCAEMRLCGAASACTEISPTDDGNPRNLPLRPVARFSGSSANRVGEPLAFVDRFYCGAYFSSEEIFSFAAAAASIRDPSLRYRRSLCFGIRFDPSLGSKFVLIKTFGVGIPLDTKAAIELRPDTNRRNVFC